MRPTPYEWLLLAWLIGNCVAEWRHPGGRQGLGWVPLIVLAVSSLAIVVHCIAVPVAGTMLARNMIYIRNQLFALALLFANIQILK